MCDFRISSSGKSEPWFRFASGFIVRQSVAMGTVSKRTHVSGLHTSEGSIAAVLSAAMMMVRFVQQWD
jgi:hypothetical protein